MGTNLAKNNRQHKGQCLTNLPDNYTMIDIETTGLSSEVSEIIELSAIKVRNRQVTREFTTLVKPKSFINSFISQLTGITNDMVKTAPQISDIIEDYITFIGNDIVMGYNVNFDINFIYDNYERTHKKYFRNDFVDLLKVCKKHCTLPNYKLKTVSDHYNISTKGHHRGLNDCHITNMVYNKVYEEISKN